MLNFEKALDYSSAFSIYYIRILSRLIISLNMRYKKPV